MFLFVIVVLWLVGGAWGAKRAVKEDALGQLLRASFTDSKGTTERTVFVPESGGEPTP